jgi:hypothetical protein
MNWKIFIATAAISQALLIATAVISVQIWEFYGDVYEGGGYLASLDISYYIAIPVTLIGIFLILLSLLKASLRMRLVGLALSSGLFLHYDVITAWIFWFEFEGAPSIPLLGIFTNFSSLIYEGELRWFWLVQELAVLFLLVIALGIFFLYRKEKSLSLLRDSSERVGCPSCGANIPITQRFCTQCGSAMPEARTP